MPVYIALDNGYVEIIKLLLDRRANTIILDNNGNILVYIALLNSYIKLVKLLLKYRGNVIILANNR